jgi:hypothetical protein
MREGRYKARPQGDFCIVTCSGGRPHAFELGCNGNDHRDVELAVSASADEGWGSIFRAPHLFHKFAEVACRVAYGENPLARSDSNKLRYYCSRLQHPLAWAQDQDWWKANLPHLLQATKPPLDKPLLSPKEQLENEIETKCGHLKSDQQGYAICSALYISTKPIFGDNDICRLSANPGECILRRRGPMHIEPPFDR